MNRLESTLSPETLESLPTAPIMDPSTGSGQRPPTGSSYPPGPAPRLVALIPDADFDNAELARRICTLAAAEHMPVLLFGLYQHPSDDARLRRQMVTTAAFLRASLIDTQIQIEPGHDWGEAARAVLHPDDSLVCVAGQQIGLLHRSLNEVLSSGLGRSVHMLSLPGPVLPVQARKSLLAETVAWGGAIGIIVGFFWLQVRIGQLPGDWAHSALLYLSVIIEIILVLVWNSLFSA